MADGQSGVGVEGRLQPVCSAPISLPRPSSQQGHGLLSRCRLHLNSTDAASRLPGGPCTSPARGALLGGLSSGHGPSSKPLSHGFLLCPWCPRTGVAGSGFRCLHLLKPGVHFTLPATWLTTSRLVNNP